MESALGTMLRHRDLATRMPFRRAVQAHFSLLGERLEPATLKIAGHWWHRTRRSRSYLLSRRASARLRSMFRLPKALQPLGSHGGRAVGVLASHAPRPHGGGRARGNPRHARRAPRRPAGQHPRRSIGLERSTPSAQPAPRSSFVRRIRPDHCGLHQPEGTAFLIRTAYPVLDFEFQKSAAGRGEVRVRLSGDPNYACPLVVLAKRKGTSVAVRMFEINEAGERPVKNPANGQHELKGGTRYRLDWAIRRKARPRRKS